MDLLSLGSYVRAHITPPLDIHKLAYALSLFLYHQPFPTLFSFHPYPTHLIYSPSPSSPPLTWLAYSREGVYSYS